MWQERNAPWSSGFHLLQPAELPGANWADPVTGRTFLWRHSLTDKALMSQTTALAHKHFMQTHTVGWDILVSSCLWDGWLGVLVTGSKCLLYTFIALHITYTLQRKCILETKNGNDGSQKCKKKVLHFGCSLIRAEQMNWWKLVKNALLLTSCDFGSNDLASIFSL